MIYKKWAQSQKKESWARHHNTGAILCRYLDTFSHLLTHPQQGHLIQQWLENKNKQPHWKRWYALGIEFWDYLKQKKVIDFSWASTFLLDNIPSKHLKWNEVIFDMGFDMYPIEAEIISQISSKIPVKILIPLSFEKDQGKYTQSAYHIFQKNKKIKKQHTLVTENSISVRSFSTPLAEVKDITGHIRKTLDKGVAPEQITVLAPHIEDYWTCLKPFLQMEGIPFCKREVVLLSTFPSVQLWLALMQTHLSIIKYENLELIKKHIHPHTNFSLFQSRFYHANYIEQLPIELIKKQLLKNKWEMMSARDFIKWALKLNSLTNSESLISKNIKNCLTEFLKSAESFSDEILSGNDWLTFLESILKNEEITTNEEQSRGIQCLSFNALNGVQSDYIYIAGLSEQNLRWEKHNVISDFEAESIGENLGFFLKTEDSRKWEKMISQFIQQSHKETILSFSRSDFYGTHLNPSRLWLEKAQQYTVNIGNTNLPHKTLWDFYQQQNTVSEILKHRSINHSHMNLIEQSIKEDLGQQPIKYFSPKCDKRMSPSVITDYAKCPFIFASRYIFKLCDDPEHNVDIPNQYRGQLIHKLFEVLKQVKETSLSDENILQKIDQIKEEFQKNIKWLNPLVWEKEKKMLLKKAKLFLDHERKRSHVMKDYKTIEYEKEFNGYWNRDTQSLSKQGTIPFKGKIDRIDYDKSSYIIFDYKGASQAGWVAPSWEKYNHFQLALYIRAVELGLSDLKPLPVNGALYMSYKDFKYQGMALANIEPILTLSNPNQKKTSRLKSVVTLKDKENILNSIDKKVHQIISNIQEGKFQPKPQKMDICIKCRWRKLCRAPHLN